MLDHAARIGNEGIYVAPSVDFIPFPYPPLYSGVVALLGSVFGISYQVGRAISILALLGTFCLVCTALILRAERRHRPLAAAGAMLAIGAYSSIYPWVEGWHDLVRVDSLFLLLVLGGNVGLIAWARSSKGWRGHAQIGLCAAMLTLSFFCKQTGVFFVAAGGPILLVLNWRRLPVYVAVAGVLGLGGTAIINMATDGWFWTYTFEVMKGHEFNWERFYDSFSNMLWRLPALTAVIALAMVAVATTWIGKRSRPASSGPLFMWSWLAAVATLVGALGWAKTWAHFNAYMPAMLMLSIAGGASISALAGCVESWTGSTGRRTIAVTAVSGVAVAAINVQLIFAWWQPSVFIPSDSDRAAGSELIENIRNIEGEVFIPFHPWYARLAGKQTYLHRMPAIDLSYSGKWKISDLSESLRCGDFGAVVWDTRGVSAPFTVLKSAYVMSSNIPSNSRPRVFSGAGSPFNIGKHQHMLLVPSQIWTPKASSQCAGR